MTHREGAANLDSIANFLPSFSEILFTGIGFGLGVSAEPEVPL